MNTINILLTNLNDPELLSLQEQESACTIANKKYHIIDRTGNLQHNGVIVLNNLPVKPEGRTKFEERFLNRPKKIENEDGFIAIRVMRPLESDTYVILSQWASEDSFRAWQQSSAYSSAHKHRGTKGGIDQEAGVLQDKPYHKIYNVGEKEQQ